MRVGTRWTPLPIVLTASALGWTFLEALGPDTRPAAARSEAASSPVFTPAHRTALDAVRDFFNRRPAPIQPVAFTHKIHLANGMQCKDCHTGVERGPDAAIPGVQVCMACHQAIATDRPEIRRVAAYMARGEEIPWQRVYDYNRSAHVRFNHAAHIRAKVECATCHGDMRQQTIARRAVNLNMGYCLDCHKQRGASIECIACHL